MIDPACPQCHEVLSRGPAGFACTACGRGYALRDGIPDFVTGARFEDAVPEGELAYEEDCCIDTTRRYWIPAFRRLLGERARGARVLAVGCGVGTEIDELQAAGFDSAGIDSGNRASAWSRRASRDRLFLANGERLPFRDDAFDVVFCGCLFPHVGDEADSHRPGPGYLDKRRALAAEMARVLRPGGHILVASANRRCPLDLFHGREPGSYRPRWNPPGDPFLLSEDDYRDLFARAGCAGLALEPTEGFWTFNRSRRSLRGRLLALPVRLLFWLESRAFARRLRGSPVSPWIVAHTSKPA
ncbi:MAG: class I SAM-dependent methyltransferase [Burkholderiales bacterium]|nr:class I SAM-dependent methyltransferase [Burkholderiales bacterium]MBZ0250363.1 class I SAM-dependent methyltransferase [Burkholderiales bacterium]MCL4687797.1 methyltransferase domain-containing protein [Burkholderiales bacterium]